MHSKQWSNLLFWKVTIHNCTNRLQYIRVIRLVKIPSLFNKHEELHTLFLISLNVPSLLCWRHWNCILSMFSISFLAVKHQRAVSAATPLYKFDYYENDMLKMNISIMNRPQNVTTKMFVKKVSGEFVRVRPASHHTKLFNLLR